MSCFLLYCTQRLPRLFVERKLECRHSRQNERLAFFERSQHTSDRLIAVYNVPIEEGIEEGTEMKRNDKGSCRQWKQSIFSAMGIANDGTTAIELKKNQKDRYLLFDRRT